MIQHCQSSGTKMISVCMQHPCLPTIVSDTPPRSVLGVLRHSSHLMFLTPRKLLKLLVILCNNIGMVFSLWFWAICSVRDKHVQHDIVLHKGLRKPPTGSRTPSPSPSQVALHWSGCLWFVVAVVVCHIVICTSIPMCRSSLLPSKLRQAEPSLCLLKCLVLVARCRTTTFFTLPSQISSMSLSHLQPFLGKALRTLVCNVGDAGLRLQCDLLLGYCVLNPQESYVNVLQFPGCILLVVRLSPSTP